MKKDLGMFDSSNGQEGSLGRSLLDTSLESRVLSSVAPVPLTSLINLYIEALSVEEERCKILLVIKSLSNGDKYRRVPKLAK